MLDFVLNLLIFFIITTSFVKESGINVTRPVAFTSEAKQSGNILIGVRENGEVWIDRRAIDIRDLRLLIERMHVERPEDTVVIVADASSPAGVVGKVMDEVRLGGIKDVAIGAASAIGG
jgi:biopolymer transport protein ExbD